MQSYKHGMASQGPDPELYYVKQNRIGAYPCLLIIAPALLPLPGSHCVARQATSTMFA